MMRLIKIAVLCVLMMLFEKSLGIEIGILFCVMNGYISVMTVDTLDGLDGVVD